jgi:hypothetical protein
MEPTQTCVSYDIDPILDKVFARDEWKREINKQGLTVLFYGIDLLRIQELTSTERGNRPAYIAIGLVNKTNPTLHPVEYTDGYPFIHLLLQCLNPWKWSEKGKHTVYIHESNIELNISDYALDELCRSTPVDTRLVARPDRTTKAESAMCCESTDAKGSFMCFQSKNQILFCATLWGLDCVRMFHVEHSDCRCNLETILEDIEAPGTKVEDINSLPLLDTTQDPDIESISLIKGNNDSCVEGRDLSIPSHIPPEVRELIKENMDGRQLVHNVQAGFPVAPRTLLKAQHAFVWTTILKNEYKSMEKSLREGENLFLLGLAVEHLYYGLHKLPPNAPRPLEVIMSGSKGVDLNLNPKRFNSIGKATIIDPLITLCVPRLHWDNTIVVQNIGNCIKKTKGVLEIPILYLQSTQWGLQAVNVQFQPQDPATGRCSRYCFSVGDKKIYLAEAGNLEVPWHERF